MKSRNRSYLLKVFYIKCKCKLYKMKRFPQNTGHIGIAVPDVDKACERFEKLNVEFVKKPNEGKMKGLAFIKDPDGYWIEILNGGNVSNIIH